MAIASGSDSASASKDKRSRKDYFTNNEISFLLEEMQLEHGRLFASHDQNIKNELKKDDLEKNFRQNQCLWGGQ